MNATRPRDARRQFPLDFTPEFSQVFDTVIYSNLIQFQNS